VGAILMLNAHQVRLELYAPVTLDSRVTVIDAHKLAHVTATHAPMHQVHIVRLLQLVRSANVSQDTISRAAVPTV
jgi:hypothetical protein